jgi:NhaP-type Na+/H+ or K+/H+ antiporter
VIADYTIVLALGGLAFLIAAWLPSALNKRPLSLPIVLVAAGAVIFLIPGLDAPDPREHVQLTERLTELGVIVALLGAGLKLDRPVGWRRWSTTWRLLGVTMILGIGGVALLGWSLLGLAPATALLLGAVLAPTDPVLAADVQVGEPSVVEEDESREELGDDELDAEDEVRFGLTSEAGLNDGLAFPFVYAAIAAAAHGAAPANWFGEWLAFDVLFRIAVGVAMGFAIGRVLGVITFQPPGRLRSLAESREGFVALAATFVAYGATEVLEGYGFLAVFVTALTLRHAERGHSYHRVLHGFANQIEQMLVVVLLVLLGGAVTAGLLTALNWQAFVLAATLLLVLRPATGMLALAGSSLRTGERWALSFFGIRGIGSLYYLAYALGEAEFAHTDLVWSTVALTIIASIALHGITATPAMRWLDASSKRNDPVRAG